MTERELKEIKNQIIRIREVYKENRRIFLEDGNISTDERKKLQAIDNRLKQVEKTYKAELKKFQERDCLEIITDTIVEEVGDGLNVVKDGLGVAGEAVFSVGMTAVIAADALITKTGEEIVETVNSLKGETSETIKDDNIIDSSVDGVLHYFEGEGKTVELGAATKEAIKKSKDMLHYIHRITTGLTPNPAEGSGLPIDLTFEGKKVFHVGKTVMSYQTICENNLCTTTFTVAEEDGFWDPIYNSDGDGSKGELPGGTIYKYKPFSWDHPFDNPGYTVGKDKRPVLMLLPPE